MEEEQWSDDDDGSSWGNGADLGAPLAQLEGHLRCAICRSFFTSPVGLQKCDHVFCSECIRRHLAAQVHRNKQKSSCPVCNQDACSNDIRPLKVLAGIIEAFRAAKPGLLPLVTRAASEGGGGRPRDREAKGIPPPSSSSSSSGAPGGGSKNGRGPLQLRRGNINLGLMAMDKAKRFVRELGLDIPKGAKKDDLQAMYNKFRIQWQAEIDGGNMEPDEKAVAARVNKHERMRKETESMAENFNAASKTEIGKEQLDEGFKNLLRRHREGAAARESAPIASSPPSKPTAPVEEQQELPREGAKSSSILGVKGVMYMREEAGILREPWLPVEDTSVGAMYWYNPETGEWKLMDELPSQEGGRVVFIPTSAFMKEKDRDGVVAEVAEDRICTSCKRSSSDTIPLGGKLPSAKRDRSTESNVIIDLTQAPHEAEPGSSAMTIATTAAITIDGRDPEASPAPATWRCTICTLENQMEISKCSVCDAARPGAKKKNTWSFTKHRMK